MNALATNDKVIASPLGLQFRQELSFEEWSALAPQLGTALRSTAFVVGDWLVYGEDHFAKQLELPGFETEMKRGRISADRYQAAWAATGIDKVVLKNYAYVSRRVPLSLRNEHLSWEHHKAVAKLEAPDQTRWLERAADTDDRLSSRRLRVSITQGKVVPVEAMATPPADQGIINHITPINRLCGWWQITGPDWIKGRTHEQTGAMLRDFAPLKGILAELERHFDATS